MQIIDILIALYFPITFITAFVWLRKSIVVCLFGFIIVPIAFIVFLYETISHKGAYGDIWMSIDGIAGLGYVARTKRKPVFLLKTHYITSSGVILHTRDDLIRMVTTNTKKVTCDKCHTILTAENFD